MPEFQFIGRHVVADVYDIDPEAINDTALIMRSLEAGIKVAGAQVCGSQVKHFEPSGFTALYLLSESHVSVHTYPDDRSLFFDAFTCGDRCRPKVIIEALVAALGPCESHIKILERGDEAVRSQRHLGVTPLAS
jgi:S-adenosylmethionine decarboxylase